MKIIFEDKKLEKIVNDWKLLQKAYGKINAKKIRNRLDDLHAVETLQDMKCLPGKCHELKENRKGQLAVHVEEPDRIIFVPDLESMPPTGNGALDWKAINCIKIIEITNYHGK
jgi:plasmid maintenance system killer protein